MRESSAESVDRARDLTDEIEVRKRVGAPSPDFCTFDSPKFCVFESPRRPLEEAPGSDPCGTHRNTSQSPRRRASRRPAATVWPRPGAILSPENVVSLCEARV